MRWIAYFTLIPSWVIWSFVLNGQKVETRTQDQKAIARVETARDHLTVIELSEPVTMVAVGNQSAFLVERRGNKVFVKPTEEGAQTNLFIWTDTGRYTYELLPAKAIAEMHFAIDHESPRVVATVPAVETETPLPTLPEAMLTQATPVSIFGERETQGRVEVSIRDLYRKDNRLYLRYALINRGSIPYQPSPPAASQLTRVRAGFSLIGLGANQLGERVCRTLKAESMAALPVLHAQQAGRVEAGGDGIGWLVIDAPSDTGPHGAVLRLRFAADTKGDLAVVVILPVFSESVREVADAGRNANAPHR